MSRFTQQWFSSGLIVLKFFLQASFIWEVFGQPLQIVLTHLILWLSSLNLLFKNSQISLDSLFKKFKLIQNMTVLAFFLQSRYFLIHQLYSLNCYFSFIQLGLYFWNFTCKSIFNKILINYFSKIVKMIVFLSGFIRHHYSVNLKFIVNFINFLIYFVKNSVKLFALNLQVLYFSLKLQDFLRINFGQHILKFFSYTQVDKNSLHLLHRFGLVSILFL